MTPPARLVGAVLVATLLVTGCATPDSGAAPGAGSAPAAGAAGGTTAAVRDTWFVAPTALGPGWSYQPRQLGVPRWPWAQDDCPTYRDADYPAQVHRVAAAQRRYHHSTATGLALAVVEVFQPDWAAQAIADAEQVVRTCPTYRFGPGTITFELLDPERPAALLVRGRIDHPQSAPTVSYFLAVRHDDTVATLSLPDPGSVPAVIRTLDQMVTALTAGRPSPP